LLDLLSPFIHIEDEFYDKAQLLQEYAVGIRYPNPFSDPTEEDVKESLASAEFFQLFAKKTIGI
jgi:HEPN domain